MPAAVAAGVALQMVVVRAPASAPGDALDYCTVAQYLHERIQQVADVPRLLLVHAAPQPSAAAAAADCPLAYQLGHAAM